MKRIPLDRAVYSNDDTRLCPLIDKAFELLLDDEFEPLQLTAGEKLDVIRILMMISDCLLEQGFSLEVIYSFIRDRQQIVRIPDEQYQQNEISKADVDELERQKDQVLKDCRKIVILEHLQVLLKDLRDFPGFARTQIVAEIKSAVEFLLLSSEERD